MGSKNSTIESPQKNSKLSIILIVIAGIAIFISMIVIGLYASVFHGPLSDDHRLWASFGAYLGGVLGPIFGFLSLLSLLITLSIQNNILKTTSDSFLFQKKVTIDQDFERLFFELLKFHIDNRSRFSISGNLSGIEGELRGLQYFKFLYYEKYQRIYKRLCIGSPNQDMFELIKKSYSEFYDSHSNNLEPYFKNVYFLIEYIEDKDSSQKNRYYSILKNQLSKEELFLLFYDAIAFKKLNILKKMVQRKDIDEEKLVHLSHIKLIY